MNRKGRLVWLFVLMVCVAFLAYDHSLYCIFLDISEWRSGTSINISRVIHTDVVRYIGTRDVLGTDDFSRGIRL